MTEIIRVIGRCPSFFGRDPNGFGVVSSRHNEYFDVSHVFSGLMAVVNTSLLVVLDSASGHLPRQSC